MVTEISAALWARVAWEGLYVRTSRHHLYRQRTDHGKADVGFMSWTNEDAVIFGKRHQILPLNEDNNSRSVADLADVLALMYVYN